MRKKPSRGNLVRKLISHSLTGLNCDRCGRKGSTAYRYDGVGGYGVECIWRVADLHEELGNRYYDRIAYRTVDGAWKYHGTLVRSSHVAALAMNKRIERVVGLSADVFAELKKDSGSLESEAWAPFFEKYESRGETIHGR